MAWNARPPARRGAPPGPKTRRSPSPSSPVRRPGRRIIPLIAPRPRPLSPSPRSAPRALDQTHDPGRVSPPSLAALDAISVWSGISKWLSLPPGRTNSRRVLRIGRAEHGGCRDGFLSALVLPGVASNALACQPSGLHCLRSSRRLSPMPRSDPAASSSRQSCLGRPNRLPALPSASGGRALGRD